MSRSDRRKDRRKRITTEIEFYLKVLRICEWTSNHDIIDFLSYSSRGKESKNGITPITLGSYLRPYVLSGKILRQEKWLANECSIQYRWFKHDEEE